MVTEREQLITAFPTGSPTGRRNVVDGSLNTGKGTANRGMSSDRMMSYLGIASTAADDIASMIHDIESKDVRNNADARIDNANASLMSAQTAGDTVDSLMSDWASNYNMEHISGSDLGAYSDGKLAGNAITSAAKGAASGASLGPIGAIAGAVGGLSTSLIGGLTRNSKANKQAVRVNEAIDYRNQYNLAQLNNRADNLMKQQFNTLNATYAALGGPLAGNGIDWSDGLMAIDAGGSHESNPNDGVIIGMDEEGNPNLVEEGETIFNDYVFSRRLKVPKAIRNKYKLKDGITFAEASKKMAKEAEERPNDPISQRGLKMFMADLANAQEQLKAGMNKRKGNKYAKGGSLSDLRYVPALGSIFGTVKSILDNPDYEMADALIKEGKSVTAPTVGFTPIGNYIDENPMDRLFYINQMNAQSGATRRGIVNMAGLNRGNAMAGLLAADNNYLNQLGTLIRQAEEYNYNNRLQARTFNRATNQYNSEGMLKADIANAESRIKANTLGLETVSKGYQLRQAARDTRDAAISANLTNLFDNIGNIGWEEYQRMAIESNPALLGYYNDRSGWFRRNNQSKNGGFLTVKKK